MLVDAWFPHIGGGQVHVLELSKELIKKGCEVKIITRDLGKWSSSTKNLDVIRVGRHKNFADTMGRFEYLFLGLLHGLKQDFDILHAHAFSPGLITPIFKIFRNKPIVFTVHGKGVEIAGLGIKGTFLQDLIFYKLPYDLQITVAKSTIEKKVKAKRLIVIPNGIVIDQFVKAQKKRDNIKNITYVGRLSNEKGVDLLLDAYKKLSSKALKLTIVGEGAEEKKLRYMAKGQDVSFTGKLEGDRLIRQFLKADLLVLPSRTEGHPITLFEGWASKIPVLATDVGDNRRYIRDSINGFLMDSNVESIAKNINRVVTNTNLEKVTEKGYEAVKKYTWDKIAARTLRHYKQLVK